MKTILTLSLVLVAAVAGAAPRGPFQTYLVEPCRLVDTRTFPAAPFVEEETRSFEVQEHCGVPLGAAGAILNVTVVGATVSGHLRVWRADLLETPQTSTLNFSPGQTVANGLTVELGDVGPRGLLNDLTVYALASGGQVHIIIDVVGFLR